jgi:hypothetical protein
MRAKNNGRHMFGKLWKNLLNHARWAIGTSIEKLVNPFYFLGNSFNGTWKYMEMLLRIDVSNMRFTVNIAHWITSHI